MKVKVILLFFKILRQLVTIRIGFGDGTERTFS